MPQMENAAHLRRRYSDIDLIVSCGDMPAVYLEFITSVLNIPLFYVRGNHDERYEQSPPGGENLHRRAIRFGGLTFAGLEGCINYNNGLIQYTEQQMLTMVLTMAPGMAIRKARFGRGVDVFVAHSPVRGIHDAEDVAHKGFVALKRFLNMYRPRYMLHGHVHTYDRRKVTETQYQDTMIMNINPVTILEIEPEK